MFVEMATTTPLLLQLVMVMTLYHFNNLQYSISCSTCVDVNECAYDNGGCQHQCINSGGSYRCECNSGYYLQADKKSCATTPPGKAIL